MSGNPENQTSPTLGSVYEAANSCLAAAGVASPRLDARLLIAHVLGVGAEVIIGYPERHVSDEDVALIDDLIERRAAREPLARIVGVQEFWSLPIRVSEHTLIPRPDSETLMESVVEWAAEREEMGQRPPSHVLDLGTGSGCLLFAALNEFPDATGVGVDVSAGALKTATATAADLWLENRVLFVEGQWDAAPDGPFDVILSNPPYIPQGEIEALEPEVAGFDPHRALVGGADGLECYRDLMSVLSSRLAPGGRVFLEIGMGQADDVSEIIRSSGLYPVETKEDLSGIVRCVMAVGEAG